MTGGSWRPRTAALVVVGWVVAGLVVGGLWRVLTPVARGWADSYEQDFAGDATLAVLGAVAGLVVAVVGLVRSGPGSAQRFAFAVLGSGGASMVAVGTGLVVGAPAVTLPGVMLLWPLTVALVTVLVTLVVTLVVRETYDD